MSDSYEDLPYSNNAFAATSVVNLSTVAKLHGLSPTDPRQSRVLELGCGRGGNLLPMAETLPESEFVGMDLSPGHIDAANADVAALGMSNVCFEAADILDWNDDGRPFDYIIAHGIFSWVPQSVQNAILKLASDRLSPNGLMYVSYNTYPGWHYRGVVREMLQYHVDQQAPVSNQLEQARSLLQFVSHGVADRDGVRSVLLREECEHMLGEADSYLYHEHLEATNSPCYFHEFAARLPEFDLQFVSEAQVNPLLASLSGDTVEAILKRTGHDRIHYEQYIDFLSHGDVPSINPVLFEPLRE